MANKAYDRVVINARERPLSSDLNQLQSERDRTMRDFLSYVFSTRFSNSSSATIPKSGVLASSFQLLPTVAPSMAVNVTPGQGFKLDLFNELSAIDGIQGLDDLSTYKPCFLSATQTLAVPSAPTPGNERWDIVEINPSVLLLGTPPPGLVDPLSRDIFNVATLLFNPTLVRKTFSWDMFNNTSSVTAPANNTGAIGYKAGVVGATGFAVVPPTSPGYIRIGIIYVAGGATSVDFPVIQDRRPLLFPNDAMPFGFTYTPGALSSGIATGIQIDVPAGIYATVVANDHGGGGPRSIDCFLFPGEGPVNELPVHASARAADVLGLFSAPVLATSNYAQMRVTVGIIDSTLQTTLANPGVAAPALAVAIGQPFVCVSTFTGQADWVAGPTFVAQNVETTIQGFVHLP